MMIQMFVSKKLDKDIKNKIKNKEFTQEELTKMYNSICNNTKEAKAGFIFNAIIFLLIFGFMGYKATEIRGFATIGIILSIVFYAIVMVAFYLNMTSAKRSFTKLVKENYSDIADKVLS